MRSLLVFVFLGLCGAALGWWAPRPRKNFCANEPCQNDGKCVNKWFRDGYYCVCPTLFKGKNCGIDRKFACDGYLNRGPCYISRWYRRQVDKSYPMEDPTMFVECDSGECKEQSCPPKQVYIPELQDMLPEEPPCLLIEDEDDEGGKSTGKSTGKSAKSGSKEDDENDEGGKSTGKSTGKKSKKSGSKEDNEDDEGGVDKSTGKSSKKSKKDPEDDEGGAKSTGKSSKKSKKDPEDDEGKKGGKKE